MKKHLIFTSTTEHLLNNLRERAPGFNFILPEKNKEGQRFFPDGEIYMRLPEVKKIKGQRVIVLHSGAPNPNDGLMELKLLLHILRDHQIKPELFFTYFPYGQQDKVFARGEGNIAESLIKKFVNYYRVKKIHAIDPHFGKMPWVKKYPITTLSAISHLTNAIKQDLGESVLFLSPDRGGKRRSGISGLEKQRKDSYNVDILSPKIALKGKTVVVVDDLLETGGTLARFYEVVKKSGANDVAAMVTHGVLDSGIERIKNVYSQVYITNSINKKEANIDIVDIIINHLSS